MRVDVALGSVTFSGFFFSLTSSSRVGIVPPSHPIITFDRFISFYAFQIPKNIRKQFSPEVTFLNSTFHHTYAPLY